MPTCPVCNRELRKEFFVEYAGRSLCMECYLEQPAGDPPDTPEIDSPAASGICSVCGKEVEAEELSELNGEAACLDCIAEAGVLNLDIPLEQIANRTGPAAHHPAPPRRSRAGLLIRMLLSIAILGGGGWYLWRLRHRDDGMRTRATALKAEGDRLAQAGKFDEALNHYEEVVKLLEGKPLEAADLVELFRQTEKAAAAPYHKTIMPRLERVEALLLAGRQDEAREQFRQLANYINSHTFQPELSVRERIDGATDQLRMPRIARANWRKQQPAAAVTQPPTANIFETTERPRTPAPQEPIASADVPRPRPLETLNPTPPPQQKPPVIAAKPALPVAVPDPTAQAAAERQIRARFADNYAQREAPARRALAHLLLITAQEGSSDASSRFVLLRESRDIAARAGEPRIALAAVDEMAKSYLVNGVELRIRTLAEASQNAFGAEASESVAEVGLALAERMVKEQRNDEAYRCAVIANNSAQQSRNSAVMAKTAARLKELSTPKRN